jgi:hypothetical protein
MSIAAPPGWLSEEAEIRALLDAALDRFDRQRGVDRQRQISLAAEEFLPSLALADGTADQTWALVQELARRGVLTVRAARRNPYDPDWTGVKLAFAPSIEGTLRAWLGRDWCEPAVQQWRSAVQRHAHAFHDGGAALLSQRIAIANRSADDIVAAMAAARVIEGPLTLRQLSATLFWGDSKILDDRGELAAALWPKLDIRERALVVATYLPETCRGVLFIENQDTYTAAAAGTQSEAGDLALVFASGFRGAASRIRTRTGAVLHYAGPAGAAIVMRFDAWWYGQGAALGPCWFWGDLDFAGMQILKSLRSRFEGMEAWQPGYEPFLTQLSRFGGYGAAAAEGKGQLDPGQTGCAYADSVLLPAIRKYGQMDQERVRSSRIA